MPDPARTRIVIVGAGLGGLAAACELASAGLDVTLIDANSHAGGKMNVLEERGYSFDMGPTIITLPQVLRGIFERAGKDPDDYLTLIHLDPQWRCFYEDGAVIDLWQDEHRLARALDERYPAQRPGAGYLRFLTFARRMFKLSEQVFFYKDLGAMTDLMRSPPPRDPALLKDVLAMRLHSTVAKTIHRDIPEPHVRQMCEHFMQYVGSSPFLAPAILSLIAAAQVDHGCCYPMGGTREVARSLARLASDLGVRMMLGSRVVEIQSQGRRVTGVALENGQTIEADAVVSNCDVQRTYRDLIRRPGAAAEQASIASSYRPACSGVVLYLGLDRQYDQLAHHNFFFSASSEREFEDIYTRGVPARDPTLYIAAPSRTDDRQAPAGAEALYVLIHTPFIRPGQVWDGPGAMLERYRPVILEKLERMGLTDIQRHIVVERHLTPSMIDRMYNAEGGAIYGLASHGRLKGGFKPRNRARLFGNLYFAGGSVNPGAGVPMVLMSGVTAARAVREDLGLPAPVSGLDVRTRRAPATPTPSAGSLA